MLEPLDILKQPIKLNLFLDSMETLISKKLLREVLLKGASDLEITNPGTIADNVGDNVGDIQKCEKIQCIFFLNLF